MSSSFVPVFYTPHALLSDMHMIMQDIPFAVCASPLTLSATENACVHAAEKSYSHRSGSLTLLISFDNYTRCLRDLLCHVYRHQMYLCSSLLLALQRKAGDWGCTQLQGRLLGLPTALHRCQRVHLAAHCQIQTSSHPAGKACC